MMIFHLLLISLSSLTIDLRRFQDGKFLHRDIDFVASNRRGVQRMAPERTKAQDSPARHESYGRNPKYLEERKKQMEEEKELRRRNMPDPDCPKGMKLMPDEERLSTLENLQRSKAEVLQLLGESFWKVEGCMSVYLMII